MKRRLGQDKSRFKKYLKYIRITVCIINPK